MMKLDKIPEMAIDCANTFTVEEHTGGRAGIGAGPATGCYTTKPEAIHAMAEAVARGNSATCITRNKRGEGKLQALGLVKA